MVGQTIIVMKLKKIFSKKSNKVRFLLRDMYKVEYMANPTFYYLVLNKMKQET